MTSTAKSVEEYLAEVPAERQESFNRLRQVILEYLPDGFEECMSYGMIGYVVPHSIYRAGYHCDPKLPLPFLSVASQKNFIGLYHMGIYADPELYEWYQKRYAGTTKYKVDMSKSCIRFKKEAAINYELIGELVAKMTSQKWIVLGSGQIRQ